MKSLFGLLCFLLIAWACSSGSGLGRKELIEYKLTNENEISLSLYARHNYINTWIPFSFDDVIDSKYELSLDRDEQLEIYSCINQIINSTDFKSGSDQNFKSTDLRIVVVLVDDQGLEKKIGLGAANWVVVDDEYHNPKAGTDIFKCLDSYLPRDIKKSMNK